MEDKLPNIIKLGEMAKVRHLNPYILVPGKQKKMILLKGERGFRKDRIYNFLRVAFL